MQYLGRPGVLWPVERSWFVLRAAGGLRGLAEVAVVQAADVWNLHDLFCTIAQTGQVFDFLHRPGNVHDSRGAHGFLTECLERVRAICPDTQLEVRLDSAFFSEATLTTLDAQGAFDPEYEW